MRDARSNLEDQVGGLVARAEAPARHREPSAGSTPEPAEPPRYGLTPSATATIRAARAADEHTDRRAA
jgi:hypothetical protein